jgi:hypothetical protein
MGEGYFIIEVVPSRDARLAALDAYNVYRPASRMVASAGWPPPF